MRKNCRKSWMTGLLVFCMSILMVFAVRAEDSNTTTVSTLSDGSVVQTVEDITQYRIKDNFKAPDAPTGYENYIFSGWYTDKTCASKTALAVTVTSENIGENTLAYAKFVPKEVLGVRAQVTAATQYKSDKANIRFVTSVDSANYKAVGFDCVQNGKSMNGQSNSAYQKLQVLNNQGKVMNYTPWNVFHSMSKYFMAATLPNVENADFGDGIAVTPYWITLDGTKVPGETVTKTINMSYTSSMEGIVTAKAFDISRKGHDCGLGCLFGCKDSTKYVPQGGCIVTDIDENGNEHHYYYQALIHDANTTGDTYDKSYDSSDRVYIRKHDMDNNSIVKISEDLNLHHANDITYNPDLQYNGRKGLLVVTQNHPVYTRLSFVHPDDLTVIDPEEITDLNGEKMDWAWPVETAVEETSYTDKYIEFSTAGIGGVYSINYNPTYKKYVVGLSGGQKFTFLDASLKNEGTVYSPTSKSNNFTTQGNTCDDGYIYFILYGKKMNSEGPDLQYNSHIITVYDWDGNFVTVLEIPIESIPLAQEPENISIYDNKIYISCRNGDNATVYQVDKEKITYAEGTVVATIERGLTTVEYVSLEEAMMDAEANETITIVAENVEVGSQMEMLAENVTLTNKAGMDVTITRKSNYAGTLIDNSAQNFTIKSNDSGSLTFEGTGTKKGDSWIANSVDGELKLENITVQNVSANKNGGAVRVEAGQVTIDKCIFKSNINSAHGGAICSNGTLTVKNSIFEQNCAKDGGAIYNRQETAKLNVENCRFGGTTEDENGETVGLGNIASGAGGAIYNGGSGTVIISGDRTEKSTFEGNQAGGSNGGGAICIGTGTLTLDGYAFKNNKATIQGGAIALRGGEKSTISNSSFEENEAETKYGGAIHNRSHHPTITNCTFDGNKALLYGGALYNEYNGQVTLKIAGETENKVLTNNSAGTGGAITNTSGKVSVDGYTFDSNNANKVVIGTETSTAEDGTETVTDIYSDAFGGAIYSKKMEDAYDTSVETIDCVFKGNTSETNGGAIYNDTSASCTVQDTQFTGNKAGADGGAIYNSATLNLVGTKGDEETVTAVFDNNGFVDGATSVRGAAIYNGNTLNATAYVFKNHVTTGNGGAICNYGRNPKFTNCQFISNQGAIGGALYSGGGVKIYLNVSAEAPELTALCEGNVATTRGGAIGAGYGHTYVDGYEFKGNHAPYGGALYLENDKQTKDAEGNTITVGADSSITNSKFSENYSTCSDTKEKNGGGAIYILAGEVDIEACNFDSNTSITHAGAVYTKAVTDVTGCTFTSNKATLQGGAIKVEGSTAQLNVKTTVFGGEIYEDTDGNELNPGNVAETSGGAVYGAGSATITVGTENGTKQATEIFKNNKAKAEFGGGAICVGSGILRVYGYTFTDNYATKEGGAIAKRNSAELTVKDALFKSNETGDVGGAIRSYATTSTIMDTTFTENKAATRGGAIYSLDLKVDLKVALTGSSFDGNSAVYGGAINCEGETLEATSCHFMGNISTAEMTTADAKATELTGRGGGAVNLTANAKGIFDGTGTFTSNKAENALGGAIYTTDAELSISGYTFSENVAYHAGAILIDNVRAEDDETFCSTDIEIKDSKFEQNQSTELGGGAIYLIQRKLILSKTSETTETETSEVTETVFKLNHAKGSGGAISNEGGTLEVSEYIFLQNDATDKDAKPAGGAIYNTKETTIKDCMFDGNTATGNGGAIGTGNSGSSLTLNVSESPRITSVFQNNSSGARGGAIGHTNGTMDIYGYQFLNNSAVEGGAISRQSATEIKIQDSPYSLVDAMFKGNNATSGGAIFTTNGTTEISDYTFVKNSATNGGAICANGGTIKPTDCKFGGDDVSLGNSASNYGGAIYLASNDGNNLVLKSDDNESMAVFKNNSAKIGGAISETKGNLEITGYKFESNTSTGVGGAIWVKSYMIVDGCAFNQNKSTGSNGGAISIESITEEDKVVVKNSTFDQNTAKAGSSINMPTKNYLTLENCQFTNGTTTDTNATYTDCGFGDVRVADNREIDGFGLKIKGKIIADIYMNQADKVEVVGALTEGSNVVANWRKDKITGKTTHEGIVFDSEADMNASKGYITLSDNQNKSYAIKFAETTGTLVTVLSKTKVTTEDEFINELNLIKESDDKTGAIVLGADITISAKREFPTGCDITIVDDGTTRKFVRSEEYKKYLLNVTSGATVTFASTGGNNTNPRLIIDGGNVECTEGNTLLENNGTLTVCQGIALQNNQTSGGNQGIALYSKEGSTTTFKGAIRNITSTYVDSSSPSSVMVYGTLTFDHAVVENNVTNKNGMVRISKTGSLTAENTEFKNNTAGSNGGIIFVDSATGTVQFEECTFTNNKANGGEGGVIYNYAAKTTVINCKFDNNTANTKGGAIYCGGSGTLDITGDGTENSKFINNKTNGSYGGAICIGSGKLVIEKYKFDTNTATAGQGGAVYVTGSGENYSTITSCKFINNNAKEAGALHVGNSGKVTVDDSQFTTNTATTDGGAVSSNGLGAFDVKISTFSKNETKTNGGAICVNCTGTVLVEGSEFNENKTTGNSGGAIYVYHIGAITVNTTNFNDNYAKNKGGAICCEAGTVKVNTCDFISNDAASDGGAIRIAGNYDGDVSDVELNGGKFEGNTSGGAGGAIKFNSGTLKVTGYIFTDNTATGGGNALSTNAAGATLTGCTLKKTDILGSCEGTEDDTNNWVTEEESSGDTTE